MALIAQPPTSSVDIVIDPSDATAGMVVSAPWATFFSTVSSLLIALTASGTTAQRPTRMLWAGRTFYDTSLNKPVWYTAAGWRDATGALV